MIKEETQGLKLLYVEDDDITRENAVEYLENSFTHIYEASNALDALKLYEQIKPDIIITDIQMPKLNGLEFIERLRKKKSKARVIVISAFSSKDYLFKAIELQLVKYLIKPINEKALDEALQICVRSLQSNDSNIISIKNSASFDMFNKTLLSDNCIVKLRTKELSFLELLLKNQARYVTYEEIETYVWFEDSMSKDALKTLVKNLKSKLPSNAISNLSGTGYKIELI